MDSLMKSLAGLKENRSLMLLILAIGVVASFILLYSMDNSQSSDESSSLGVFQSTSNSPLSDFEMVLSQIDGAGSTRAYITYETGEGAKSTENVKGIVIVSQGAGDLGVRMKLLSAASTAFDVPADKIEVFEMKKGEQP